MVSSGLKRLSQPSSRGLAAQLELSTQPSPQGFALQLELPRLRCALFATAIVLAFVLWPALAQAQAKPRAERPTYTLGEKWVRNDGLYELIRIEKDIYVFSMRPRWEIHLTKDLGIARAQRGDSILDFKPPLELKWPLEVGKSGFQHSLWETPGTSGRSFPVTISWRVVAYEDMQVFAGTFKAFHIVLTVTNQGGRSWENHLWYSPEARQYIKADGQQGLLRFQLVGLDHPTIGPIQFALEGMPEKERVGIDTITLGGKVTAGKGLASVVVTVNGAEVASKNERRAPKPEIALDVPIKLREGKNVVIVTAVDAEGTTRQEARGLVYLPPRGPAVVGAPPGPGPPIGAPIPPPGAPPLPQPPLLPQVAAPAPAPRAVPLQVTLSSPPDQARFDNETVALAGLASGGKSVRRVAVSLNGLEVARQEPGTTSAAVNLPLKLREGQNTVVITATDADGVTQQEVRTVYYEKAAPLTVSFRYPEDRSRVNEESSVVAALVTSSKGVAKVTVALNGTQVHQQSDKTPPRSIAVSAPVTFREGANAIVVTATEPDGTIKQELRTVIYDKPKPVAAAPAAPSPPLKTVNDRWAVVIGVGRYQSTDIPSLRYSVADAEALYQVLIGPGGFRKDHVLLLSDRSEKPPTLRNIKWALGTFLARSAKKDDTVVIFFAGHGAPEVDQRGVERDGLAKYLIPADADPDDLYSTALPMDEMQTIFGRVEAERMVVFLDACYSGAAGGRTFSAKRTRATNLDDQFLERLTRSKGRAIITASRPSEVSIELPELGHGIFTYYLVEGLKGAADLNKDGIVTVQELYEYLEHQVAKKSRAVGGNQHPVMKGEMEGALPLVKVSR
jgi:uncharacterized caspase-like protein